MNIKSALIGYTGFVGSNLVEQYQFDKLYNSKNITEIEGREIDLLVCAGVYADKWLANQEPEVDISNIEKLKNYIQKAKIRHFVLISTIDVYAIPIAVNENTIIDVSKQGYYGKHRYQLEQWVASQGFVDGYTIIRLPGLFGKNLRKNFIYDILNPLAKIINKVLWQDLQCKLGEKLVKQIESFYQTDEFGNLKQRNNVDYKTKLDLIEIFAQAGFSTLNFTDSRSSFQFYNLANLWNDISNAIKNNYNVLNLSSEPITAKELVKYLIGVDFNNDTTERKVSYDMYSKYATDGKYWYDKKTILKQIKKFIEDYK